MAPQIDASGSHHVLEQAETGIAVRSSLLLHSCDRNLPKIRAVIGKPCNGIAIVWRATLSVAEVALDIALEFVQRGELQGLNVMAEDFRPRFQDSSNQDTRDLRPPRAQSNARESRLQSNGVLPGIEFDVDVDNRETSKFDQSRKPPVALGERISSVMELNFPSPVDLMEDVSREVAAESSPVALSPPVESMPLESVEHSQLPWEERRLPVPELMADYPKVPPSKLDLTTLRELTGPRHGALFGLSGTLAGLREPVDSVERVRKAQKLEGTIQSFEAMGDTAIDTISSGANHFSEFIRRSNSAHAILTGASDFVQGLRLRDSHRANQNGVWSLSNDTNLYYSSRRTDPRRVIEAMLHISIATFSQECKSMRFKTADYQMFTTF